MQVVLQLRCCALVILCPLFGGGGYSSKMMRRSLVFIYYYSTHNMSCITGYPIRSVFAEKNRLRTAKPIALSAPRPYGTPTCVNEHLDFDY